MKNRQATEANGKEDSPKIYAPPYYRKFRCIADKCRHSCCIDWEICIDDKTLEKYKDHADILNTVTECDGEYCFKLGDDGRCPHLDENGLCRIIISHGEDFLSDICRNHPRFYNDVAGRREIGLGIVCEEACRIILESDEPFSLSPIAETCETMSAEASEFDPTAERANAITIAEDTSLSLSEKLEHLKNKYAIPEVHTRKEWFDRFTKLEILDTGWESMLNNAKAKAHRESSEFDKYYSRLLSYFIYRHLGASESRENLRARLGFSILSVEMIKHIFDTGDIQNTAKLIDIARTYSAEVEYSEDNTAELIFEFESEI